MSFEGFMLNGSGFNFSLFHLLWLQDPIFKNNVKIDIPDTIEIQKGQPYFWYFSKNQQILRKSKSKLNWEDIIKAFIKDKDDQHIICAVWIQQKNKNTIFEYFSQSSLFLLLKTGITDESSGYLQKFIYPKGISLCYSKESFNEVIKCTWTNSLCFFECYTNKYPINFSKADIYQRAITFELLRGPVEQKVLKGSVLCQRLELLCGLIMNHISNVTQSQQIVINMEVLYKIGENNNIYLLFCPKIQTSRFTIVQNTQFKITNKISRYLINYPKAIILSDNSKCIGCDKDKNQIEFSKVRLIDVVKNWEKNSQQRKKQIEFNKKYKNTNLIKMDTGQHIPRIIKTMYPKMSLIEYEEFKTNYVFLNQTISLCNECLTEIVNKSQIQFNQISSRQRLIVKTECQKEDQMDQIFKIQPIETTHTKSESYFNLNYNKTLLNYTSRKLGCSSILIPKIQNFKKSIITNPSVFKTHHSGQQSGQNCTDQDYFDLN